MVADFPKLTLWKVVFLLPPWLVGAGALQCSWLVVMRGSWKVTDFVVFLMPFWQGGRYSYVVYLGSGCQTGDIEGNNP